MKSRTGRCEWDGSKVSSITSSQYAATPCTRGACDNQGVTALTMMPEHGPMSLCVNAAWINPWRRPMCVTKHQSFFHGQREGKVTPEFNGKLTNINVRVPVSEASVLEQHERDRRSDQDTPDKSEARVQRVQPRMCSFIERAPSHCTTRKESKKKKNEVA